MVLHRALPPQAGASSTEEGVLGRWVERARGTQRQRHTCLEGAYSGGDEPGFAVRGLDSCGCEDSGGGGVGAVGGDEGSAAFEVLGVTLGGAEATEEAIYHSLFAAENMTGHRGAIQALPQKKVFEILEHHRLLRLRSE